MNAEEYERMYRLEDTYWWFVGRHHLAIDLLDRAFGGRRDLRILDIGCGTGAMSELLAAWGEVVSADCSPLALAFSRRRGLVRVCAADAMHLPFRDESFDAVVALDIIEHLPDDAVAAREIRRVLRPGGRLVATVPACPSLWSAHDVALMHQRRYVGSQVRRLMDAGGLRVRRLTHATTLLFPLAWVTRVLARRSGSLHARLVPLSGPANRLLVGVMAAENALLRRCDLPFGLSVCCVAERV
ncbi:MAG TPA: class I SAM-dependent methyltransferase [Chthonomonadales bacterium]|nr:class I SAM-dependent methyltransferase [Chthonomonadales bacterium]